MQHIDCRLDGLTRSCISQAMREAGQQEAANRILSWVGESYDNEDLQPALAVC